MPKEHLPAPRSTWLNELLNMTVTSIYVPRVRSSCLLPLWEALQDQQVGLTQASFKLLILPWVSEHVRLCGHCLRVESTSHSPLALLKVSLTGLQSQTLWGLVFPVQDEEAQCGAWITHSLGRSSATVIILPFVSHPPGGMGLGSTIALPSYPSPCCSFFIAIGVDLLC